MLQIIKDDYYRTTDQEEFSLKHYIFDFIFYHRIRYMFYLRICQNTQIKILKFFCKYKLFRYSRKYGIEIKDATEIGKGFVLLHPYNITVSPSAKIGNNVTMLKGSTIGASGGKKPGAPTIGNQVYIGINSTIVGGVTIGNDVLIAPNTFVNVDVPSHSVVIGSPCEIHHKENATKRNIWKIVN